MAKHIANAPPPAPQQSSPKACKRSPIKLVRVEFYERRINQQKMLGAMSCLCHATGVRLLNVGDLTSDARTPCFLRSETSLELQISWLKHDFGPAMPQLLQPPGEPFHHLALLFLLSFALHCIGRPSCPASHWETFSLICMPFPTSRTPSCFISSSASAPYFVHHRQACSPSL